MFTIKSIYMNFKLVPKGFLRAAIIHALENERLNGYRIMKKIEKFTGFWNPSPGSVYPLLKTMVKEGLIKKDKNGFYELTKKGEFLAKKLRITKKQLKEDFVEYISLISGIDKSVVKKELKRKKGAIKIDHSTKKLLESIVKEAISLQRNKAKKAECIKILERTLKKLKKLRN